MLRIRIPENNAPNNNFMTTKQQIQKEAEEYRKREAEEEKKLKEEARITAIQLEKEARHNEYILAIQKEKEKEKILKDYNYSIYIITSIANDLVSKKIKYTEDTITLFKKTFEEEIKTLDDFVIIHPEYKADYDEVIKRINKDFKDKSYYNKMTMHFNNIRKFEETRPSRKTRKVRKTRKTRKNRK